MVDPLYNSRVNQVIGRWDDGVEPRLDEFASRLEVALATVVPEFAPIRCLPAFLYNRPSIHEALNSLVKGNGADALVTVNLHPFSSQLASQKMAQVVESFLSQNTEPLKSSRGEWMSVLKSGQSHSFKTLGVSRLGEEEPIAQFWAEKIAGEVSTGKDIVNGIIFAAPLPESPFPWGKSYRQSVEMFAKRIMYALFNRAECKQALPWRVAFYPSWTQSAPMWRIVNAYRADTVKACLEDIRRRRGREGTTIIIPLAHLFDDFDTRAILPTIVGTSVSKKVKFPMMPHHICVSIQNHMRLVTAIDGTEDDRLGMRSLSGKSLLHSFVELLKNRLLMPSEKEKQYAQYRHTYAGLYCHRS